jgi:hypothetical protein
MMSGVAETGSMRVFTAVALAGASLALVSGAFAKPSTHFHIQMFAAPLPAMNDSEFIVDQQIEGQTTAAVFSEDFASIDAMAKLFIDQHAKTTAGTWKIGHVYDAFQIVDATSEYQYIRMERLI